MVYNRNDHFIASLLDTRQCRDTRRFFFQVKPISFHIDAEKVTAFCVEYASKKIHTTNLMNRTIFASQQRTNNQDDLFTHFTYSAF